MKTNNTYVIYRNNWTGELCIPDDLNIAPPEKYLKIVRGVGNQTFIEKWTVKGQDGKFIDVACPEYRYWEGGAGEERKRVENMHDVQLGLMIRWIVPQTYFDGLLKSMKNCLTEE